MGKASDYFDKLYADLPEQFRGKPNIAAFQQTLARQLEDLDKCFQQLNALRHIQAAQGVQLDGIGDIVALSRQEALLISKIAGMAAPMDDGTYRRYLVWKIFLNTTDCTYRDVWRALTMFWTETPIYYSEDPAYPATIFLSTPTLPPGADVSILFIAPLIKAAGVTLIISAQTDYTTYDYSGGALSETIEEFTLEAGQAPETHTSYGAAAPDEYIQEETTE